MIYCPQEQKIIKYKKECPTCLKYDDCPSRQAYSGNMIVLYGVVFISLAILGITLKIIGVL